MTNVPLFDPTQIETYNNQTNAAIERPEFDRIRRSVLWAAYGDALGWISELTDSAGLRRRTSGKPLTRPIEWTRRIGGRSGVTITLPQGCYSDDSQLRLATGRAITHSGFDVDAFSKVELPVWLSYELGGGKGTTAAAANLAKTRVQWFANTFKGWTASGGNGAAMRIQPHVWASSNPSDCTTFLPDVVRNAICTHSNPNGLLGAVLHALALAHSISTGSPPSSGDLMKLVVDKAANLMEIVADDIEVTQYWRSAFERDSGPFQDAWQRAVGDCTSAIETLADTSDGIEADPYGAMLDSLRLRDREHRGSGTLTALAAVALTWCEQDPESALIVAVNSLGSDTDSIASMAGAILGANTKDDPPVEVLDADLFRSHAERLSAIASGGRPPSHPYPDLLHWTPPKSRADTIGRSTSGDLYVLGLGQVVPQGDPIEARDLGFMWQWVKLETGQTLLVKRRKNILHIDDTTSRGPTVQTPYVNPSTASAPPSSEDTVREKAPGLLWPNPPRGPISDSKFNEMIDYVKEHYSDDKAIGQAIRRVVNRCTVPQTLVFLGVLADCIQDAPTRDSNSG